MLVKATKDSNTTQLICWQSVGLLLLYRVRSVVEGNLAYVTPVAKQPAVYWEVLHVTLRAQCEEGIPKRCKNIDDLLSVTDVDY